MPIPPVDPITIATTSLTTTIRLFEFSYQLKAVGPQTADLLTTIEHVNRNLKEARRLRELKTALLSKGESEWMDGVIEDTINARLEVAKLIESVRIDQETKKGISLANRALWILRDNPDVVNKHRKLTICHQSLTTVIASLYSKDAIVITPVPVVGATQQLSPPPYDPEMAELFERRASRKQRKSISSLRHVSIGSPDSSGSGRSGASIASSATSPDPSSASHGNWRSGDECILTTSHTGSAGLEITGATVQTTDGLYPHYTPNPIHLDTGYLDESAALHALQHLSLANTDPTMPTGPARPSKIPLTGTTGSQSNDSVERVTAQKMDDRAELEAEHISSPSRRTKPSWLAYHATRSEAGHLAPLHDS